MAALPEAERARLTVATKLAPFPWRLGRGGFRRAFDASRRRLQGKLDRVQLHWSTARYAPWQEAPLLDGLADLVEAGAVAGLGLSNMGPRRLRRVHRLLADRGVSLQSLQVQFSLLAPQPIVPDGTVEVCRELGIELIAYSPLALGLLGRRASIPPTWPQGPRGVLFRRLWPRVLPLLQALERIADTHAATPAAVALNWCRAHGALPIVGLRSVEQARQAAGALSWLPSAAEQGELDQLARTCTAGMPANPFQSD
jgi:pyridoxine 4-dehydrogenase